MGGGGSTPTNSTVTQTTTNLPEYAEPYWTTLMDKTQYQTSLPYQTYQGQRVADFSPYEQEALARKVEVGMSGDNQALMEASRLAYNVGNDQFQGVNTGINSGYTASPLYGLGNYDPTSRQSGYTASNYSGLGGSGGDRGYVAGQRQVGFTPGRLDNAGMLQNYMSPYMQNVVDIEKREAGRQGEIQNQNIGLEASKQGGLGGYRDAIMRAENNRNTQQLMSDIQTKGQQAAFADAKASYEADRAARAQAEQFGQSQFGLNEQMRQTVEQLMQSGYSMEQATRQAQEQLAQGQFGLNSRNQQFGSQMGLQQYQAYEQARQQAAAMGLNAQQANQAAQIALMNGQLGYQQNQLGASRQLADYAQQQQMMELERLGLLQDVGSQQRQLAQAGLDVGYQNFLNQQAYPLEQLNFMNSILHGGAMTPGTTSAVYGPQPSTIQQLLGTGVAGLGLYNALTGTQG